MKRYLSGILLALLLCGCGPKTPESSGDTLPTSPPENPLLTQSITAGKPASFELPGQLVGTSVCRLKMLPLTAAVQRFAFLQVGEELWIFATQCSKDATYLTCFLYDPETKIAAPQNILTLTGYGHGESLEVLQRDGKIYVYIGSRAKHAFTSYYWSTTITRFCYENGKMTEVKELTDLNCATPSGEPLHKNATSYRVNFALNEAADLMALYVQCDTNDSLKKVSLIDELGASISYNLAAKTKPWSNLSTRLRLKLTKNYTFSLNATWATYAYQFNERGQVVVGDRTEWSYGRFGRFQGMSQNLSYTFNNKTFDKRIPIMRKISPRAMRLL